MKINKYLYLVPIGTCVIFSVALIEMIDAAAKKFEHEIAKEKLQRVTAAQEVNLTQEQMVKLFNSTYTFYDDGTEEKTRPVVRMVRKLQPTCDTTLQTRKFGTVNVFVQDSVTFGTVDRQLLSRNFNKIGTVIIAMLVVTTILNLLLIVFLNNAEWERKHGKI